MKRTIQILLAFVMLMLCAAGCGPEPAAVAEGTELVVHFIDVGQADAALLICDGQTMLIDGGNREDSSLIYAYLKEHDVTRLDYVVATHAHEDHIGGLPGALNYATVGKALCSVDNHDSQIFQTFVSQLDKQGKKIMVPTAGDTFELGSARVQVLGPVQPSDDPNNMSLVLRVVFGDTSFLFTGDAERPEEQDILDAGYELDSTVLKVGHHGSENSTTYPFLREIMPEYAVISVGEGNSYGHPAPEALSRLRDAGVNVLRTDESGTIVCTSDGKSVSFSAGTGAKPAPAPQPAPAPEPEPEPEPERPEQAGTAMDYVLNTNSKKFHMPQCGSVKDMKEANKKEVTQTRDSLISEGYSPCGNCKP